MTGTFTPMPGAAPLPRMVLAQARMETRLLLRNGEQLLLAVVVPLIVLVGGITAAKHFTLTFSHSPVDTLTPGVLALAVMSTSFTSLAIATGFERRYGVIKRLGSSPLPRSGLLLGKVGALLVVELLQFVLIGGAALLLGWSPSLTAAGRVRGAGLHAAGDRGLRLARAVRRRRPAGRGHARRGEPDLPAADGRRRGGVPRRRRTAARGPCSALLPSGALGTGMRAAFLEGGFPVLPLVVLAAWTAVGTVLTARTFTWE